MKESPVKVTIVKALQKSLREAIIQKVNKPRLIVLDLKMLKVSGLEVLEKLAASELINTIPLVVLTSSKEHPDVERAYQLGANSYIVKPVDFDSFRKVASELGIYD